MLYLTYHIVKINIINVLNILKITEYSVKGEVGAVKPV